MSPMSVSFRHYLNAPFEPAVRVLDLLKDHIFEDLHSALPCASL